MAAAFPLTNEDFANLADLPTLDSLDPWTNQFDRVSIERARAHGLVETRRPDGELQECRLTAMGQRAVDDWLRRPALPSGAALTPRQRAVLLFIDGYIRQRGHSPTHQEIAQAMGLKAKSGVHRLLHGLKERGAITFNKARHRSVILTAPPPRADLQ